MLPSYLNLDNDPNSQTKAGRIITKILLDNLKQERRATNNLNHVQIARDDKQIRRESIIFNDKMRVVYENMILLNGILHSAISNVSMHGYGLMPPLVIIGGAKKGAERRTQASVIRDLANKDLSDSQREIFENELRKMREKSAKVSASNKAKKDAAAAYNISYESSPPGSSYGNIPEGDLYSEYRHLNEPSPPGSFYGSISDYGQLYRGPEEPQEPEYETQSDIYSLSDMNSSYAPSSKASTARLPEIYDVYDNNSSFGMKPQDLEDMRDFNDYSTSIRPIKKEKSKYNDVAYIARQFIEITSDVRALHNMFEEFIKPSVNYIDPATQNKIITTYQKLSLIYRDMFNGPFTPDIVKFMSYIANGNDIYLTLKNVLDSFLNDFSQSFRISQSGKSTIGQSLEQYAGAGRKQAPQLTKFGTYTTGKGGTIIDYSTINQPYLIPDNACEPYRFNGIKLYDPLPMKLKILPQRYKL